jgi:Uma2 family endonuclease
VHERKQRERYDYPGTRVLGGREVNYPLAHTLSRKMARVAEMQELLEEPLSTEELAVRYRALCDDPCFAKVPGKIELDIWGRVLMSPPPAVYHGRVQANVTHKLKAVLGGHVITEASIATPAGLFLPDVAWASPGFMSTHPESPLMRAPEICVEVASPSNSVKELNEKREAYLAAGAQEVWIVYPQSKRVEFYGAQGHSPRSNYVVDLSDIFN